MADILGVRVTPQLDTLGSIAICNSPGWQANPAVTYNGEQYVVVWLEIMTDRVYVVHVTPDGTVLGTGHQVCEGLEPDVAADPERSFVVCAKEYEGIVGRFVNASGMPVDTVIQIAQLLATSTRPRVACSGQAYPIVWPDFCPGGTDLDVFGQLVLPDGSLIGDRFTIADGPANQSYPEVVYDEHRYIVVWAEEHTIVGQIITADGALSGPAFTVSQHDSLFLYHPFVCAGPDNDLVVWSRWDGHHDVYGDLDVPTGVLASDDPRHEPVAATVVVGPLDMAGMENAVLYDLSGRCVQPAQAGCGVYFILVGDRVVRKIVKVY
jgi:hypothetical protein